MKKMYGVTAFLLIAASFAMAGFTDPFNSIDPAWVTDRYEPNGFSSAFFDGDYRLKIEISTAQSAANRPSGFSSTFYNTQGRQRSVSEIPQWIVSGQVYISEDFVSGNNLRRTDLWARTGQVGNETDAHYPIIGVRRFDPDDSFNSQASNISSVWRVWDPGAGGWVNFNIPVTTGWHTLSIKGTGTSFVYSIDNQVVHTDNTINTSLPNLTTVFVQAYNFGDSDYVAYWDNVTVIPEPATMLLLGVGVLGLLRTRK